MNFERPVDTLEAERIVGEARASGTTLAVGSAPGLGRAGWFEALGFEVACPGPDGGPPAWPRDREVAVVHADGAADGWAHWLADRRAATVIADRRARTVPRITLVGHPPERARDRVRDSGRAAGLALSDARAAELAEAAAGWPSLVGPAGASPWATSGLEAERVIARILDEPVGARVNAALLGALERLSQQVRDVVGVAASCDRVKADDLREWVGGLADAAIATAMADGWLEPDGDALTVPRPIRSWFHARHTIPDAMEQPITDRIAALGRESTLIGGAAAPAVRARSAELRRLVDRAGRSDATRATAGWALVALHPVAEPVGWHEARVRIEEGTVSDRLRAHLAHAAAASSVLSGEGHAGVADAEHALVFAERTGDVDLAAKSELELYSLTGRRGEPAHEWVSGAERRTRGRRNAVRAQVLYAVASEAVAAGSRERATPAVREGLEIGRSIGFRWVEAKMVAVQATLALEHDGWAACLRLLDDVHPRPHPGVAPLRALSLILGGDARGALAVLDEAEPAARRLNVWRRRECSFGLLRALALALLDRRDEARGHLAAVARTHGGGTFEQEIDDARLAVDGILDGWTPDRRARLRAHSVSCAEDRAMFRWLTELSARAPSRPSLVVYGAGRRVELGEVELDLRRHPILARVLDVLVDVHAEQQPGLEVDALAARVWSGQRLVSGSAGDRVYAAISRLRSRGLRDVIERTPEGYRIAPDVQVIRR